MIVYVYRAILTKLPAASAHPEKFDPHAKSDVAVLCGERDVVSGANLGGHAGAEPVNPVLSQVVNPAWLGHFEILEEETLHHQAARRVVAELLLHLARQVQQPHHLGRVPRPEPERKRVC